MKIAFIVIVVGGGLAAAIYFFMKNKKTATDDKTTDGANAPTIAAANPFAAYNPNQPTTIGATPPPATAVNPDVHPYNSIIANRAYIIASRPSTLGAARVAAAAPSAAFTNIADTDERQMILSAFSVVANPLDNFVFPLPSKWNDTTLGDDLRQWIEGIVIYKGISGSIAASSWIESNKGLFVARYWNVNFYQLIKSFKLRNRLQTVTDFLNRLLQSIENLNQTITQEAKNNLTAEGYKWTN